MSNGFEKKLPLKKSYERCHPTRLNWFYQFVRDFADYKSLELIIDQAWVFERDLHKGEGFQNNAKNENPLWRSDEDSDNEGIYLLFPLKL